MRNLTEILARKPKHTLSRLAKGARSSMVVHKSSARRNGQSARQTARPEGRIQLVKWQLTEGSLVAWRSAPSGLSHGQPGLTGPGTRGAGVSGAGFGNAGFGSTEGFNDLFAGFTGQGGAANNPIAGLQGPGSGIGTTGLGRGAGQGTGVVGSGGPGGGGVGRGGVGIAGIGGPGEGGVGNFGDGLVPGVSGHGAGSPTGAPARPAGGSSREDGGGDDTDTTQTVVIGTIEIGGDDSTSQETQTQTTGTGTDGSTDGGAANTVTIDTIEISDDESHHLDAGATGDTSLPGGVGTEGPSSGTGDDEGNVYEVVAGTMAIASGVLALVDAPGETAAAGAAIGVMGGVVAVMHGLFGGKMPASDGLRPASDGIVPASDGLMPSDESGSPVNPHSMGMILGTASLGQKSYAVVGEVASDHSAGWMFAAKETSDKSKTFGKSSSQGRDGVSLNLKISSHGAEDGWLNVTQVGGTEGRANRRAV